MQKIRISKKHLWVMVFLIIFPLIVLFAIYSYFQPPRFEGFAVERIYPKFTQSSLNFINEKFSWINCNPTLYKIEENLICFNCKPLACFRFDYVERGVERKISVIGTGFLDTKEISEKLVDFHFRGITKFLNCKKVSERKLDCGETEFFLEDYDKINDYYLAKKLDEYYSEKIYWRLKNKEEVESFARRFCKFYGESFNGCKGWFCNCETQGLFIRGDRLTIFVGYIDIG